MENNNGLKKFRLTKNSHWGLMGFSREKNSIVIINIYFAFLTKVPFYQTIWQNSHLGVSIKQGKVGVDELANPRDQKIVPSK